MPASTLLLPVIDLIPYLNDPESAESKAECKKAAEALVTYSALAIRDPKVTEQDNAIFLNLIEDYFAQSTEAKMADARPEYGFQIGSTPELTELPRCGKDTRCTDYVKNASNTMKEDDKPHEFDSPDPKWRFFWRIGDTPKETKFGALNLPPVIPAAFPEWESVMNKWGYKLHSAVSILSEMVALGLDLPKDSFTRLAEGGAHLLAPTGSDLNKYGKVGTVLAGFHYDFNLLTIHGKSRFPGLHIWIKSGKKLLAKIPDGCLLVQAGKEMEYLTGGHILAGYHEVVVIPETLEAMQRQEALHRPLWRISSTLFYHVATDQVLQPLQHYAARPNVDSLYPAILTGDYVNQELGMINLLNN